MIQEGKDTAMRQISLSTVFHPKIVGHAATDELGGRRHGNEATKPRYGPLASGI